MFEQSSLPTLRNRSATDAAMLSVAFIAVFALAGCAPTSPSPAPAPVPTRATEPEAVEELPDVIEPPEVIEGVELATLSSEEGTNSARVDFRGEGVLVHLNCLGDGKVTLEWGETSSKYGCESGTVSRFFGEEQVAQGKTEIVVSADPEVKWGVSVARVPLEEMSENE